MTQTTKIRLTFLVTLLLAGLVYVWFYPLNKGQVSVNTGLTGYTVEVAELAGQKTLCPADPCLIPLHSDTYTMTISKDGYQKAETRVVVVRGNITRVDITLQKIFGITLAVIIPKYTGDVDRPLPEGSMPENLLGHKWSPDGSKLIYLDKNDGRVKLWTPAESRKVTSLQGINEDIRFIWSAGRQKVVAQSGTDLYWLDIESGSRKKQVLDFTPDYMTLSPNGATLLLSGPDGTLYTISAEIMQAAPFESKIDPKKTVWIDDATLIYAVTPEGGSTEIGRACLDGRPQESLLSLSNFPIDLLYHGQDSLVYLHNSATNTWYQLEF
jgi:WD40 repeat protein